MAIQLKLAVFIVEVAVSGGHYANWVHQRHEFLARNDARAAEFETARTSRLPFNGHRHVSSWLGNYYRKTKKDSFSFLWLLGEKRQDTIMLVFRVDEVPQGLYGKSMYGPGDDEKMLKTLPKDKMELAERLFPEANFRFRIFDVEDVPDP